MSGLFSCVMGILRLEGKPSPSTRTITLETAASFRLLSHPNFAAQSSSVPPPAKAASGPTSKATPACGWPASPPFHRYSAKSPPTSACARNQRMGKDPSPPGRDSASQTESTRTKRSAAITNLRAGKTSSRARPDASPTPTRWIPDRGLPVRAGGMVDLGS